LSSEQLQLFNAPIFHPYEDTFAYSDAILLSGVVTAPFRWLGSDPFVVYNGYLLFSFVSSGFVAALLCHRLTGSWSAAVIGGGIFTLNPHRLEHFERLELITSAGIPLAFLCWHLAASKQSSRWFAATALCVAAQWYLGMYQGLFLATVLPVLWLDWRLFDARTRTVALKGAAIGALLALLAIAPSVAPYLRARQEVGERSLSSVAEYSATPVNFLAVHPRNWLYGPRLSRFGAAERHLFPGTAAIVLSVIGFWGASRSTKLLYGGVLVIAVDLTLGSNGLLFQPLREFVSPYRGLRVPARAMTIAFLPVAVFASLGVTWLLRRRGPMARNAMTVLVFGLLIAEYRMVPDLWPTPSMSPTLWVAPTDAVIAEFPVAAPDRLDQNFDVHYMVSHIGDWRTMLNGYSGHYPVGYIRFLEESREFPATNSIARLLARGATHVAIHGRWLGEAYQPLIDSLLYHPDLEPVGQYREFGGEVMVFRIRTGK
jgi:hypothetical protein